MQWKLLNLTTDNVITLSHKAVKEMFTTITQNSGSCLIWSLKMLSFSFVIKLTKNYKLSINYCVSIRNVHYYNCTIQWKQLKLITDNVCIQTHSLRLTKSLITVNKLMCFNHLVNVIFFLFIVWWPHLADFIVKSSTRIFYATLKTKFGLQTHSMQKSDFLSVIIWLTLSVSLYRSSVTTFSSFHCYVHKNLLCKHSKQNLVYKCIQCKKKLLKKVAITIEVFSNHDCIVTTFDK